MGVRSGLQVQNTSDITKLGGSFTTEVWFRPKASNYNTVVSYILSTLKYSSSPTARSSNSHGWQVYLRSYKRTLSTPQTDTVYFSYSRLREDGKTPYVQGLKSPSRPAPEDGWRHLAFCCKNGPQGSGGWEGQVFLNGVPVLSCSGEGALTEQADLHIGPNKDSQRTRSFQGDVRALRVSSGVRYTTEFSPARVLEKDAQTVCLLDFSRPTNKLADLATGQRPGVLHYQAEWLNLESGEIAKLAEADTKPTEETAAQVAVNPSTPDSNNDEANNDEAETNQAGPALPSRSLADLVATGDLKASSTQTPAAQSGKRAVPTPAQIDKAMSDIKMILAEEFKAAKTSAQKHDLAKLLYDQAQKEKDEAACYAMLEQAHQFALEATQPRLAFQTLTMLDSLYEKDVLTLRANAIQKLMPKVRDLQDRASMASLAIELAEAGIQKQEYELANDMLSAVGSLSRRDARMSRRVNDNRKILTALRKQWKKAETARKVLASNPDHPESNLELGRYLAFAKADWEKAIPLLKKGSDSGLAAIAVKEGEADSGLKQVAAASAWYAWGEKARGDERNLAWLRAQHWYRLAEKDTTGLMLAKVQSRLEELAKVVKPVDGIAAVATGGVRLGWLNEAPIGKVVYSLNSHTDRVWSLDVSKDGRVLVSGDQDGNIFFWDLFDRGRPIHSLKSQSVAIEALALSPDNQTLVSSYNTSSLAVWRTKDFSLLSRIDTNGHSADAMFSPDNSKIAWARPTVSTHQNLGFWSLSSKNAIDRKSVV